MTLFGMKNVSIEMYETSDFKVRVVALHLPSGIRVVKQRSIVSFGLRKRIEIQVDVRNEALKELDRLIKEAENDKNDTKSSK